jgi:iron complex transport system substrate-binding protein
MGRVAVLLAAVALLATACGERKEPTGRKAQLYPVTVPTGGDQGLVVKGPAHRIAVLGPGPKEIIVALGAGKQIVGTPLTRDGAIRLQALVNLKPDLIVALPRSSLMILSAAQQRTKATVYTMPSNSIRDVERAVSELGLLVGKPVEARQLVATIEQQRLKVAARLKGTPSVTVFVDRGFFTTVSDQSLAGGLLHEAHAKNVAGNSQPGAPFDLNALVQANPDVYLVTASSSTTLADLRKDMRTRGLKAVQNNRVYLIPDTLFEPGPKISQQLVQLARLLHPNAFR